jgi:hypothetical protein
MWYRVAGVPGSSVNCSKVQNTSLLDVFNTTSSRIATLGENSTDFSRFNQLVKLKQFSELTARKIKKFQSEYFIILGGGLLLPKIPTKNL